MAARGQDASTVAAMEVELRYFDGCPNWQQTAGRLRSALQLVGRGEQALRLRQVETAEDAVRVGFRGSPTVLVNGADPFAEPTAPVGLTCRMFRTPAGLAGTPTVEQLVQALQRPLQ